MAHGRHPGAVDAAAKITKDDVLKIFAELEKAGNGSVTRRAFIGGILSARMSNPGSDANASPAVPNPQPGSPERRQGAGPSRFGGSSRFGIGGGPGGFGRGFGGQFGVEGVRGPGPHGPPSVSMFMERFDKDDKGMLTKSDVPEFVWSRISKADADNDGSVSKVELETYFKNHRPGQSPAAKPYDKPADEKPQEQKPDKSARNSDAEKPADATAASNVA